MLSGTIATLRARHTFAVQIQKNNIREPCAPVAASSVATKQAILGYVRQARGRASRMKKAVDWQSAPELEAEAILALDNARALPPGPARIEAMKHAGTLRVAADRITGPKLPRRGRPPS